MTRSIISTLIFGAVLSCASLFSQDISSPPPERLFQSAQAKAQTEQWSEAISLYDLLLLQNWNRDLVLLEKAYALEQLGHSSDAVRLYENVLARNPPMEVRTNIEKRLVGIKPPGESVKPAGRFAGLRPSSSASLGYFYDSNVNAGPATDTVFIFNLPFALSEDAMETAASGYQFQFNSGVVKELRNGRAVQASFGYNRIDYEGMSRFDFDSLQGRIEYLRPFARGMLGIPLGYGAYFLDNRFYSQSLNTSPGYRFRVSDKLESITSIYLAYNSNAQVGRRTGISTALSQNLRWSRPDGSRFFELSSSYGHEFAEADFLSSNQFRFGAGAYTELPNGFNLYVAPGFQYVQYEAADPFFGQVRREPEFVLNVNLGRSLAFWGVDCALGYTYTESAANLDLYRFTRHQASLTFRKDF